MNGTAIFTDCKVVAIIHIKLQQNLLEKGVVHVSIFKGSNYCFVTIKVLMGKHSLITGSLAVSCMALYFRRAELNLFTDPVHTLNDELNDLLKDIRREHPNIGQTMMLGVIRALGYDVSRRCHMADSFT